MPTMDYKEEAEVWMRKSKFGWKSQILDEQAKVYMPKLDEYRFKIGEIFILHP
jgi:hypothetical protein